MYDPQCEAYWDQSNALPVDAVIDYWCSGDPHCKEAKRHALLGAIERGEVEYQRSDGKTFTDPIYELYERGLILVRRESFLAWADTISREAEKRNLRDNMPIHPRAETTYLNMIGAMLDVLLGQSPGGQSYSTLNSQAAVIDTMLAHHAHKPGISQRTLEEKFALAKRHLASS